MCQEFARDMSRWKTFNVALKFDPNRSYTFFVLYRADAALCVCGLVRSRTTGVPRSGYFRGAGVSLQ